MRKLAALTQKDMGPAALDVRDGRLLLQVGDEGAGCYAITWAARDAQ